ncbi:hypothetical protein LL06_18455 [Hoeflea sp. BAL378]|uniref:DUF4917 family protein n=1 Tax=Hoeflea sp. BAL378 TaxID=1547437 RepID=UPI000512D1BE|nr:DUF4917 family protein [Hoeflea sp. BAL378]KGF68107.1 hypothetical protein LL06_18455 [Hoeflea sp. BAL378]
MTELDSNLGDWAEVQDIGDWSGLLLGNGFSQNMWASFGYHSLFETASTGDGPTLSADDTALFERFETRNFEWVLSALATSKSVLHALGQPHELIDQREHSIREALIQAVHSVHIPWLCIEDEKLKRVASELSKYAAIYSTNYDLLLYWSLMAAPAQFRDYFWTAEFDISNTEIWGKTTRVHYVHGGLHLYRKPNGQTLKRTARGGRNLLDLFATPFEDAAPLFISEGTAPEKLASIYRSDYLSFVFSQLALDDGPLVVFGHSLGGSDSHIVDVLNSHRGRKVAVAVRAEDDVRQKKGAIVASIPNAEIYFFDAATHPLGDPALNIAPPAS